MISLIVAMDKNNLIGRENNLPWYYPEDLKYFKEKTLHKTVLMGRKTFESILSRLSKPLSNRKSIVVSRNKDFSYPGIRVINDLISFLQEDLDEEVFIIGGKEIYELAYPYVKRLYISHINKEFVGDTYLNLELKAFTKISETKLGDISFCVYERK